MTWLIVMFLHTLGYLDAWTDLYHTSTGGVIGTTDIVGTKTIFGFASTDSRDFEILLTVNISAFCRFCDVSLFSAYHIATNT